METIALTRAQEVSPGFWMGNSFDCPNTTGEEGEEGDISGHLNPLSFDVCIEVGGRSCFHVRLILTLFICSRPLTGPRSPTRNV
jgi:hypothetical protein